MASHDRDFRARQYTANLLQQLYPRLVGQLQVGQHQVRRIGFQPGGRGFRAFGLVAREAQGSADGHAQSPDALLIVHYQQLGFQIFAHGLPNVVSTIEISCWTRKGFSMHGVALSRSSVCVSLLAVSPLIRMIRPPRSGRFFLIQWCTSAPLMLPGIRMSEMTPAYSPSARCPSPSAPEAACTTM